jgi:hypothetical protein
MGIYAVFAGRHFHPDDHSMQSGYLSAQVLNM